MSKRLSMRWGGGKFLLSTLLAASTLSVAAQHNQQLALTLKGGNTLFGRCGFLRSDSVSIKTSGIEQKTYLFNIANDVAYGNLKLKVSSTIATDSCVVVYLNDSSFICGQVLRRENGLLWLATDVDEHTFCAESNVTRISNYPDTSQSAEVYNALMAKIGENQRIDDLKRAKVEERRKQAAERETLAAASKAQRKAERAAERQLSIKDRSTDFGWKSAPRYRGFVELAWTFGNKCQGEIGSDEVVPGGTYISITSSHGKMFSNGMFIGGGIGIIDWTRNDKATFPIFGHFRTELHHLMQSNFAPFVEARAGYAAGDVNAWYFTPAFGWHLFFNKRHVGLGMTVGYELLREEKTGTNYGGAKWGISVDF